MVTAPDVESALALALRHADTEVSVIGGAQVYELFLPLASRLELTAVDAEPAGDAHFPAWDDDDWILVASETHAGPPGFEFQTWVRYRAIESTTRDA